jgi:hypothetical protein
MIHYDISLILTIYIGLSLSFLFYLWAKNHQIDRADTFFETEVGREIGGVILTLTYSILLVFREHKVKLRKI